MLKTIVIPTMLKDLQFRGFVRTGSTGSVEPVNLKIRSWDFVGFHSRLWNWNPWIFRVYKQWEPVVMNS